MCKKTSSYELSHSAHKLLIVLAHDVGLLNTCTATIHDRQLYVRPYVSSQDTLLASPCSDRSTDGIITSIGPKFYDVVRMTMKISASESVTIRQVFSFYSYLCYYN